MLRRGYVTSSRTNIFDGYLATVKYQKFTIWKEFGLIVFKFFFLMIAKPAFHAKIGLGDIHHFIKS